jgi:succinate dehydrogenase/fumarate reductase flavoprotein subunit
MRKWDREADVVVVGSGASGLPAAITAMENHASVILVEANRDVGGHAIISTGNIPLGGGTRAQKEAGIVDSPDILFKDLTDWSLVEPNGAADFWMGRPTGAARNRPALRCPGPTT